MTYSNGVTHIRHQCLVCGAPIEMSLSRKSVPDWESLPEWDQGLRSRWAEANSEYWRQQNEQAFQDSLAEKRRRHAEYLQTPAWRERRALRLAFDNARCQARLVGCRGVATEVHHTTYEHWGNEPLFDLVSVCRPCHRKLSEMEGRLREGDAA